MRRDCAVKPRHSGSGDRKCPGRRLFSRTLALLRIEAAWTSIQDRADAAIISDARQAGGALSLDEAAIEALRLLQHRSQDVPLDVMQKLSGRKREVFLLLSGYKTDREIAEQLFLSHRTVERHVGSILAKLDVKNRREAAALGLLRRTR